MRRTTVRIDDDLLVQAKQLAARTGRTLTAVIEDALRRTIGQRPDAQHAAPLVLPTFCGDGLQPGVDLDDSAALYEVMEATAHPSV